MSLALELSSLHIFVRSIILPGKFHILKKHTMTIICKLVNGRFLYKVLQDLCFGKDLGKSFQLKI